MEEIRLQKLFTDCGILSRRAAEEEIRAGKVTVNGIVATVGQKVCPERDVVEYKGKRISLPTEKEHIYIILNKPCGIVTSAKDEKGRPCVTDLVKVGTRLYPVGRLDLNSEGLLLMTNDGDLTNKLTHPRHEIPKIYEVEVRGAISSEQLFSLNQSMVLDGYRIMPVKTELISRSSESSILKMTLFEGRNRQIRRMCELCELKVIRLTRTAIGTITLKGLAPGKWRHLTKQEVDTLKK